MGDLHPAGIRIHSTNPHLDPLHVDILPFFFFFSLPIFNGFPVTYIFFFETITYILHSTCYKPQHRYTFFPFFCQTLCQYTDQYYTWAWITIRAEPSQFHDLSASGTLVFRFPLLGAIRRWQETHRHDSVSARWSAYEMQKKCQMIQQYPSQMHSNSQLLLGSPPHTRAGAAGSKMSHWTCFLEALMRRRWILSALSLYISPSHTHHWWHISWNLPSES